ncbi:MAG TPA: transglutaminase-like domain-containing protein [Variovorax sp.]|nr:transglutaminase-like domain-containing protein [Variovorax sp.]
MFSRACAWRAHGLVVLLAATAVAGCVAPPQSDPDADAPQARPGLTRPATAQPASYAQALQAWASPEQVNAWIGQSFEYDMSRALRLSESQRLLSGTLPIHAPPDFYAKPQGVCVDLARFAVETLQAIDAPSKPSYLMIEFDPVRIRGNTLRRHWLASFERDGQRYFFADSKRPGHIAGPYASTQDFIDDYARYRGRPIVAFRELAGYQRRLKAKAVRPVAAVDYIERRPTTSRNAHDE